MKQKIIFWLIWIIFISGIVIFWRYLDTFDLDSHREKKEWNILKVEQKYIWDNFKTNTQKSSINLDLVLDGWPWKDGIPAIDNPVFISLWESNTQEGLSDESLWISVSSWSDAKFYPYSVLYWHEIVNDVLGDMNISVTFCPLCGTAIVYNREINWEIRNFWVSGKLYESNLLMYDDKNESLWSQSIWKAVIWEDLWKELELIKSNVMSFSQFKNNYPEWKLLSENTWFVRNYSRTPYGNYEENESLYFPVQNTDTIIHQKELMFVIPYKWDSHAFVRSKLIELWEIEYNIWTEKIKIISENWEITANIWNEIIPWYIEMWFSWFTQHPDNENVWTWN